MLETRLMSTRARIVLANLVTTTLAVGVAAIGFVGLGRGSAGLMAGVGLGIVAGAVASRLVERWKLAPLNERIWAGRQTLTAPGDTGRRRLLPASAPVDAHLDALLRDMDEISRELNRTERHREALAANLESVSHDARAAAERHEQALVEASARAEASRLGLRVVGLALQSELATAERLLRTQHGTHDEVESAGERASSPELEQVAFDMLERARSWLGLHADLSAVDESTARPDAPPPSRAQSRIEFLLPQLARSAAVRLEREVLVRVGESTAGLATHRDWTIALPVGALLDALARRLPPGAPLSIDAERVAQGDTVGVQLRLGWFDTAGLPGRIPAGPDIDALADGLRAVLRTWYGRSEMKLEQDAWTLMVPAATEKHEMDSGLRQLAGLNPLSALVLDPYGPRRALLCEFLGAWRLVPTAAGTIDEALARMRDARRARRPFDVIFVIPDASAEQPVGDIWSSRLLDTLLSHPKFETDARIVALPHVLAHAATPAIAPSGAPVVALERPIDPFQLVERLSRPPGSAERTTDTPRSDGRSVHVLVGEDNAVTQLHLTRLLEQRGITVTLVDNGADVVDRFLTDGRAAYDAVLLDIQMPLMDGYEAAQIIRAREARDGLVRIPIIAVTAHAMAGERARCLQAGMDEHLTKPLDDAALFSTLGRLTGRRFVASGGAAPSEAAPPGASGAARTVQKPVAARFNREHVLEFAGEDPAFVAKLSEIFARTAPRQMQELRDAFADADMERLRRVAHQLKGAVGNFGAEAARLLAAEIEEAAREDAVAGMDARIDALGLDIEAITRELAQLAEELAR